MIVPKLPSVAIQPIIQTDQREYSMFEHWQRYRSVLDIYRYKTLDTLLAALKEHVIDPAEQRANEIAPTRSRQQDDDAIPQQGIRQNREARDR